MEEQEIRQVCLKLMETADAAYLSTISDDGYPHTRMMGNLRNEQQCKVAKELFAGHDEDFLIYMLTGHSSDKMRQIRANSKVSVYFCNAAEFHTLLLTGNAEEIDDPDLKKRIWQDEWKIHWPGGPEDPEFIMLKLLPEWAKGWYKEGAFEFKLK
ncbi:MAG: pyridoxamine 5'-phosphate oxidase family protein [Planctomycetota bacterium]|jgi:general stress protein 26